MGDCDGDLMLALGLDFSTHRNGSACQSFGAAHLGSHPNLKKQRWRFGHAGLLAMQASCQGHIRQLWALRRVALRNWLLPTELATRPWIT